MASSTVRNEEGGTDQVMVVGELSRPEQHAILKARADELGLEVSPEELEVIAGKEAATSPQYLVIALRYLKLRRDARHALPWLHHLPATTVDLLAGDGGVLDFLERLHGKDLMGALFRWLCLVPVGLCLTDLQAMIFGGHTDTGDTDGGHTGTDGGHTGTASITAWHGDIKLPSHREAKSVAGQSLAGLLQSLTGWVVSQTSYNGMRQTLYTLMISSHLVAFAVAKRYSLYSLDNCDRVDVAIEADKLCRTVSDTTALRNYIYVSSGFDAVNEKEKVLSMLSAERKLSHEVDYNQLSSLVQSCGRLTRSSHLDKTLAAFEAVAKLQAEIDVKKMRDLLSQYKIVARHSAIDEARRILFKVLRMSTERNFMELKLLYASTKRFRGSEIIDWTGKMLEAQHHLPAATTCKQLRDGIAICGGLLECHNLKHALQRLSAIEHVRLRSSILKEDFDVLTLFVDKHSRAPMERLFVPETKAKVKVKKMTWRIDSSCLVSLVNARKCEGLLVDTAMENMRDPGPVFTLWWETFDHVVTAMTAARDKANVSIDGGFQLRIEEDNYSQLQIELQQIQHITDVQEIDGCLAAMEALRGLDTTRSLATIMHLLKTCGHIKAYKVLDQFREALAAHDSLDTERDIKTLKKFLTRCQWIQDSEKIERAKLIVSGITEIENKYGISSGGKQSIPASVLFDFVARCSKYTGSEAVDTAVKIAQALSQLEMEGDVMRWTTLLDECAKQANLRPLSLRNEWDVGQVNHLLALAGHVTDEVLVSRAKQWYQSVVTLTSSCKPEINCGGRQISSLLLNCGPLHGKVTCGRVINGMILSHTAPLSAAQKELLTLFLHECNMPKSEPDFQGWSDLTKMVDLCSGVSAHSAVTREDVRFFPESMALLRARNAVDAFEELQSETWPRHLPHLRRLVRDCERIGGIPELENFRSKLADINTLAKTNNIREVIKVVESTTDLTGCKLLEKARAQYQALSCLEQELNKNKLEDILNTCEGLQGSALLDRARQWIIAEAKLEGPLSAQEFGLVTMERNFAEMQRLTLLCGDMQGSLVLDTSRHLLHMCGRLDTTFDSAQLRKISEYIVSHQVTNCPGIESTLSVLDQEASLETITDVVQLILAVVDVEVRLQGSALVEAANQRIMHALARDWRNLLANTSQTVLTKLLFVGLDLEDSQICSLIDSRDDYRQALSTVDVKLQAILELESETQYPRVMDLLETIGDVVGSPLLARARTWAAAVQNLTNEEDATRIRECVLQCVGMTGSGVLDKARQKVQVLNKIETLPELEQVDPMFDDDYSVDNLSHYCATCQNVKGHPRMTMLQHGFNAVKELESFGSFDTIEEFPKYWSEVAGPNITTTANQIWSLVDSLTKFSEMNALKGVLAKLDTLNSSKPMLDELYACVTSQVSKTPGFSLVSNEPWHVTISNQAHELKKIVEKTFFVFGSAKIWRARNLVGFFNIDPSVPFCREIQLMPEVLFKLRGGEVGQQMIGLILATQAALDSGPYQHLTKAVVTDVSLFQERSFPKILQKYKQCADAMPLLLTDARTRASKLIECEKALALDFHRRFDQSSYKHLASLAQDMDGILDCPVLDATRQKLKLIGHLETARDYLVIRDLVPHVQMIQGCDVVERAKQIVARVREMMSTKDVMRLRLIVTDLERPPHVTGIPDFERIKELLLVEAGLDDLNNDAHIHEALNKVSSRIHASASIDKARVRISKIDNMCQTNQIYDLFTAAKFGDVAIIKHYFYMGATVHDMNEAGETALMHACASGRLDAIEYLLVLGARISDTGDNGYNCLHFAVCAGHLDVVQFLVPEKMKAANMCINATVSPLKCTAVHLAAKHGHAEIASYLMEHNANAEAGDSNANTALLCALSADQPDTAMFLIESGCDLHARNADHYTALHLAAKYGHVQVAKFAVDVGVEFDSVTRAGLTAMHLAAQGAHLDMCFWLLYRHKHDINVRDNCGDTPLHHAASVGHLQLVKMLLAYGANPHLQNYVARGYVALDIAKSDAVMELLSKYMGIPVTKARLQHEAKLRCTVHTCEERCDFRGRTTRERKAAILAEQERKLAEMQAT